MNRRQKTPPLRTQNPAYRPAFERLDEALSKNTRPSNEDIIERIDLLRLKVFGCAPGTVILSD
jgi:hypothetical protein